MNQSSESRRGRAGIDLLKVIQDFESAGFDPLSGKIRVERVGSRSDDNEPDFSLVGPDGQQSVYVRAILYPPEESLVKNSAERQYAEIRINKDGKDWRIRVMASDSTQGQILYRGDRDVIC